MLSEKQSINYFLLGCIPARILIALILSLIVALSTSSIAWLLDPGVKKIFIENYVKKNSRSMNSPCEEM